MVIYVWFPVMMAIRLHSCIRNLLPEIHYVAVSDGCGKMLRAEVVCVSCAANLRDRIV
jgi:hypothetical protein